MLLGCSLVVGVYDALMNVKSCLFSFGLALLSLSAHAQELELKGFKLGAPMEVCPDGSTASGKPGGRQTMCSFGPTTVANQPAKDQVVVFSGGVVVGVMIRLARQGFNANGEVLYALREKFGQPSADSKPHINQYNWARGSHLLSLDGYKGLLMLLDLDAHRRDREIEGKQNKDDL